MSQTIQTFLSFKSSAQFSTWWELFQDEELGRLERTLGLADPWASSQGQFSTEALNLMIMNFFQIYLRSGNSSNSPSLWEFISKYDLSVALTAGLRRKSISSHWTECEPRRERLDPTLWAVMSDVKTERLLCVTENEQPSRHGWSAQGLIGIYFTP